MVSASAVRASTASTTFDLAGSDASAIRTAVEGGFSSPLALHEMIRITFVVGGGKQSRQKYDGGAMQAVTSTLKQLGYVEDRGASCVLECGGCYKSQHDTGKNVYTVVVFPRVTGGADVGDDGRNESEEAEPLIPTNSPGYKMAVCSKATFQNLLSTYCPTYLEKRECLNCLEGLLQLEQAIENKLMTGNQLDSAEQSFYDESSDLKGKHAYAQKEASRHVEDGRLTLGEKAVLVEMNEKRIENLMNEKSSAAVAEKLKKALARKQQLKSLKDDMLQEGSGSYPPPLRHESQITSLRKKLLPLRQLEESSKGRLLTLGETRSLTEKAELEGEIERLEYASCGWFEEEEAFEKRLRKSREGFDSKHVRSKRGVGGGKAVNRTSGKGAGGGSAANKWILPSEKPKNTWGASSGKKLKGKGGAVFSAMMMDSSSDEEEESDDEEGVEDETSFVVVPSMRRPHPGAANVLTSKKAAALMKNSTENPPARGGNINISDDQKGRGNAAKPADAAPAPQTTKKNKKKRKKNKKSKQSTEPEEVREEMAATDDANAKSNITAVSRENAPSAMSESLLEFWRTILFPLVMFVLNVLTAIVIYVFGGSKKKGDKKKRG